MITSPGRTHNEMPTKRPNCGLYPSHSRLGSALRSRTYPHRDPIVIRQSPLPVPIDFSSLSTSWTRPLANSTTNVVASSEKHVIYVAVGKSAVILSINRRALVQCVKSRGWNVGKLRARFRDLTPMGNDRLRC